MARLINRLTDRGIAKLSEPGYYADGNNLVLQVSRTGTKSWILRYKAAGKRREMGLGPLQLVPLAEAREKAHEHRRTLLDGDDPIRIRDRDRHRAREEAAKAMTFRQCAERCIEDRRAGWKNAKHAQQWENTLATYVHPHIGGLDVRSIDTGLVRRCLDPIWMTKTETASRVRQRIETVLDWAKVHGHRGGDNPAAWRGHLEGVMPPPTKVAKAENHAALPYAEMPRFIAELRRHEGAAAKALEFLILTAARTGEAIGATWAEIDEKAKTWTIPAERMKAGTEHVVPLTPRALAILKSLRETSDGSQWVFPGAREGRPLSNMAMLELVRGMKTTDTAGDPITVHGFRSTFRQWAAECTKHPREVAEHALAHQLPDKVEAAYQRGTMVEKRKALMTDWARYIEGKPKR